MDIKYFSLCEWVERDLITLERIATSQNMSDHFTKQLPPTLFHRHVDYLMGHVPPQYSHYFDQVYGMLKKETPLPVSLPFDIEKLPSAAAAATFVRYYILEYWVLLLFSLFV